ncbi:MAG TPA: hypothetical protein VGY31_01805 [Terriglobia bacterium]|nr:hypothetical protein [Terriglobia bacterium]
MKKLFTERHGMSEPRVKEELDGDLTRGLLTVINAKIDENLFGGAFSEECPDGGGRSIGCDLEKLRAGLAAYNVVSPRVWPNENGELPSDAQLFDLVEFLYEHAGLPEPYAYHQFFGHSHFSYDEKKGRARFEHEVNRFFERNGLAFELTDGEVQRMAPSGLQEALASTVFRTGDADLDRLLETAREKFLNRSLNVRKEGLEKLWDAWERLKTIEKGRDKSAQVKAILDKSAAEPVLRERLETEARELNFIGNNLMIRHTEVGKPPICESAQVDYLFHRMFAMIRLLLRSTHRGG